MPEYPRIEDARAAATYQRILQMPRPEFELFIINAHLPHWLCKQVVSEYFEYHAANYTRVEIVNLCPQENQ